VNNAGTTTTNTNTFTVISGGSSSNAGDFVNGNSLGDQLNIEGTFTNMASLTNNGVITNDNILTNAWNS
jgi:hypothetical protein